MDYKNQTGCPFTFSMRSFGDKWTLLILREIIIMHKVHYDDFLTMEEGISTNILADRLKDMIKRDLITRKKDEENKRRWIYKPTKKALDLIPMMVELILWAGEYDPKTGVTKEHMECFSKKKTKTIKDFRKPFE